MGGVDRDLKVIGPTVEVRVRYAAFDFPELQSMRSVDDLAIGG